MQRKSAAPLLLKLRLLTCTSCTSDRGPFRRGDRRRHRQFSYDLWGNTVNVASRMESEGIADQIQISTETRELLSERYQISPHGEVLIKDHRPRATYLLEGHGL